MYNRGRFGSQKEIRVLAHFSRSTQVMSTEALRQLEALSEPPIQSLDDARHYVANAATWMRGDSEALPESCKKRVAAAELAAASDRDKLVPDQNIADAFAFLSRKFNVTHSEAVTSGDVREYRCVMAALFPQLFSQSSPDGVRPVGAAVMLYLMIHGGGIPQGAREIAKQGIPKRFRVDSRLARLAPAYLAPSEVEYQSAYRKYCENTSPQEKEALVEQLMKILELP